jgi:ABC-2 type transport system ATP-binding protein
LVLLAASRPQLCGDIDAILAQHRLLTARRRTTKTLERNHAVVETNHTPRQTTVVVRTRGPVADPAWTASELGLEEIVLAYMSQAAPQLSAVGHGR